MGGWVLQTSLMCVQFQLVLNNVMSPLHRHARVRRREAPDSKGASLRPCPPQLNSAVGCGCADWLPLKPVPHGGGLSHVGGEGARPYPVPRATPSAAVSRLVVVRLGLAA